MQHLSLEQAQQALLAILPKLKTEPVAIADALAGCWPVIWQHRAACLHLSNLLSTAML